MCVQWHGKEKENSGGSRRSKKLLDEEETFLFDRLGVWEVKERAKLTMDEWRTIEKSVGQKNC